MKYRDDIDPDNTWVVSDTHFGHDNIVGFCHRPEDHEQVMIAEWRKEVPDDATVLHLGDLCYRGNARFKNLIAPELTGARKLLILGNHDRQRFAFYRQSGFRLVKPFKIAVHRFEGLRAATREEIDADLWMDQGWHYVSFDHYPADSLPGGTLHLHGHIHNNGYSRDAYVPFLRDQINMSVEQTKYKPVNLGLLLRAVIAGKYPATTEAQLQEARDRREANRAV